MSLSTSTIEAAVQRIGGRLLDAARELEPRPGLSDRVMDAAMADPAFKTSLFRFIDVFPVLQTSEQVHEHFTEYLREPGVLLPPGFKLGLKAGGLFRGTLHRVVSSQVESMARRFIAGQDVQDALPRLRRRWQDGIAFSIDLLGEACLHQQEAHAYQVRYLETIGALAGAVGQWPAQPRLDADHLGPIPRGNISIKVSALAGKVDPLDYQGSLRRLMAGVEPILAAAAQHGFFVNFDMEQHALKDLTLDLFMRCCEASAVRAGIALQAYLRSAQEDARRLIAWSRRTGRIVTVRLVKGAYWDYECIEAQRRNWPVPVWTRKSDTDACYERVAVQLLEASPRVAGAGGIKLALGSHNARSIAYGLAAAEHLGLPPEAVELQMLFGMAEGIKRAAVEQDLRVREYVPIGQVVPGMAYLVRRLLENTSNESWLRAGFARQMSHEQLLAPPPTSDAAAPAPQESLPEWHALSPVVAGLGDGRPFFTEPSRDFSDDRQRRAFAAAIAATSPPRVMVDSSLPEVGRAVATAADAFARWRDTDALDRARCLVAAAAIFRSRRDELAALVLRESGKPWRHADADVCEAIDFCEYYARCGAALFAAQTLGRFLGESNHLMHEPRGPAVVISPWNFPLAIACGMTAAALVTGNPVLLKPAEQSPAIGLKLCEAMWQAGVPRQVLQYVPGPGETVGAALVRDPRVALICFTGSKAVGLEILGAAAQTDATQSHVKHVVCEMGGKNAIIIDSSADLDEAIPAVIESAFGYSGQRCSACSRLIVLDDVHDRVVERLVETAGELKMADPSDPACDVGPLIDADAGQKVREYLELGRREGHLALSMEPPAGLEEQLGRPVVGPHIFTGIRPEHRLAQEEVFGPVLAVMRATDFTHALALANSVPYRLTGAVFSRTPTHLERARREFRVGNLYLNRGSVGALVGRQPFGGFGLSGGGTQAGGPEYLLQFVVPRVCCENTLRRGFAPGESDARPRGI
jgi:RHH-type proline utilization regulon transcriptional repressor/proline dehydrogenase/delta 1-pyrroline-5-carboxylate dehydrogenase